MQRIIDLGDWLNDMATKMGTSMEWFPPLVARLILGVVFVQSGWGKLHSLDNVIGFFRDLGIPWPEIQAPFAAANELIFGALVLAGVATRFAAIPLIAVMLVAIKTAIWPNLETAAEILNASEFLYIALLLWLAMHGGGALSVDGLVSRVWHAPNEERPVGSKMSRVMV